MNTNLKKDNTFAEKKGFLEKYWKTLEYGFKSTFKSARLYVFSVFLPIFIYLFVNLLQSNFDKQMINPGIIMTFLFIPSLCSIFLVSAVVTDWRESIFFKQMHLFKINKVTFILAFLAVFIVINIIFLLVFILLALGIDLFLTNKSFTVALTLKSYNTLMLQEQVATVATFRRILGIFYLLMLSSVFYFFVGFFFAFAIKNIAFIQIINLLIVSISLIAGDIMFNPNSGVLYNELYYFGFLIPQKYFTWFMYGLYVDLQTNDNLINLVIVNLATKLFLIDYYFLVPFTLLWTALISVVAIFNFNGGKKHHEKIT
ncbi:hypothetical protein [Spiroplasma clarkii]|uniref:Uncharacterized protein n=1 Tax=Spiroplasma clarkii TaxID=2139 RepID=A0A2K8KJL3_9MOLU|nr:hypothetical protein [Spiroplasma clarkii]ATX70559.1 hypothetical protein SCLAR_v1c02290 [Spiroplasma clarkii]